MRDLSGRNLRWLVAVGGILALVACQKRSAPAPSSVPVQAPPTATGAPGGPAQPAPPSPGPALRHPAMAKDCAGFDKQDAAAVLGVPESSITARVDKLYEGNWSCLFEGGQGKKVVLNVAVAESAGQAAEDMAQYRNHLDIAGKQKPFQKTPDQEAYSKLPLGDEALWTPVNDTLSVRRDNVTIQISEPPGKHDQVEVARRWLARMF